MLSTACCLSLPQKLTIIVVRCSVVKFNRNDLKFANYIVCHFGDTYMDDMTGDPHFILDFQRGYDNDSLCKVYWISDRGGIFLNVF